MEIGHLSQTDRIILAEHLSKQGRRVVSVAELIVAIDEIATRPQSPDITQDAGQLEAIASAIDAFGTLPKKACLPGVAERIRKIAARMRDYQ
ncbi:hypothetical protein LCGC14_2989580 [marine sediment metagenome]|uniref:Uncharacterized protein n=1 Tax=marine sediment metagenome TaxID=412755 RepID=A0A0F8ZBS3_9ZZZZ